MNAARDTQECLRLARWVEAALADELDAVHVIEVEDHLAACEPCREQAALSRAMRASLRVACRDAALAAPQSLRARAAAALLAGSAAAASAEANSAEAKVRRGKPQTRASDAPAAREDDDVAGGWLGASRGAAESAGGIFTTAPKLVRLRYVMPLAAVATLAIVLGAYRLRDRKDQQQATVQQASSAPSAFDRFIDDLVDAHIQPPPPEVTDYAGLDNFVPYVGVRVPHPELRSLGARYLGAARVHERAAMLQFAMGDRRRVTMYVFDPTRVPMRANHLQPRVVGKDHLYVGRVRGYTVAAAERDGVGYALASDLGDKETTQVLVMAEQ